MAYNVLVIGAAGFLGSQICKKLLSASCNVTAIDNLNNFIYSSSIKYKRLQDLGLNTDDLEKGNVLPQEHIEFHKLDIADAPEIRAMIIDGSYDCVIHFAGFSNSSISKQSSYAFLKNNVLNFFNIIDAIKEIEDGKRPHIILASDARIKNYLDILAHKKEDPFKDDKLNLFVATKLMEKILANSYSETEGVHVSVLDIYSIYGPFDRPDMIINNIFSDILDAKDLHLEDYHRSYDLLYIDDFTDLILNMVLKTKEKNLSFSREYDVGSGKAIDTNALFNIIKLMIEGVSKEDLQKELVYKDEYTYKADISAIQKDYGFAPKVDLIDGLHNYFKWLLEFKKK